MQTYYRNVTRRHFPTLPHRLCKLGEFLLGEAFLWIWQIVKECEKSMIEKITVEELKQMQEKEGIVFQGCGGELQEWEDGVNELLTESGILLDGDTFKNIYAFENEGLTNLFFDMEGVKLNMGKLTIWRINTHQQFGGTWLSDYLTNRFGMGEELKSSMEPEL